MYIDIVRRNQLELESMYNSLMLEWMDIESDILMQCKESGMDVYTLLEANKPSVGDKVKAFFEKVKEFLRGIVDKFKDVVKGLIQNNQDWIKENGEKLRNMDYDGLHIEMTPFYNMNTNTILKINDEFADLINNYDINSFDEKKFMSKVNELNKKYTIDNKSLSESLNIIFRVGVGKKQISTVALSGNQIKAKVNSDFIPYIEAYHSDLPGKIAAKQQKVDSSITRISKNITTRANSEKSDVQEAYSILHNCFMRDIEELNYIHEADESDSSKESKDDKINTRAVTITDTSNPKDSKTSRLEDKLPSDVNSNEVSILKELCSATQTVFGVTLTVLEEKYRVYMSILRQLMSNAKKESKGKAKSTMGGGVTVQGDEKEISKRAAAEDKANSKKGLFGRKKK